MYKTWKLSKRCPVDTAVEIAGERISIPFPVRKISIRVSVIPKTDDDFKFAALLRTDLMGDRSNPVAYVESIIATNAANRKKRHTMNSHDEVEFSFAAPLIIDGSYDFTMWRTNGNKLIVEGADGHDFTVFLTFFNEL